MELIFVDRIEDQGYSFQRGGNVFPSSEELEREILYFQENAKKEGRWDNPTFDLTKPVYVYTEYRDFSPLPVVITFFQKKDPLWVEKAIINKYTK